MPGQTDVKTTGWRVARESPVKVVYGTEKEGKRALQRLDE